MASQQPSYYDSDSDSPPPADASRIRDTIAELDAATTPQATPQATPQTTPQ
jgi:hypothetical protein